MKQSQALSSSCFMLVSCLAYSLSLKMEVTCSTETSVDFQWTTHCYIPGDRTLHDNDCENLKSHIPHFASPIYLIPLGANILRGEIINCCYGHSSSRWHWQGSCDGRTSVPRYRTHWPYQYGSLCSAVMARKATRNGEWRLVPNWVHVSLFSLWLDRSWVWSVSTVIGGLLSSPLLRADWLWDPPSGYWRLSSWV
jgi:hypothetical protein